MRRHIKRRLIGVCATCYVMYILGSGGQHLVTNGCDTLKRTLEQMMPSYMDKAIKTQSWFVWAHAHDEKCGPAHEILGLIVYA